MLDTNTTKYYSTKQESMIANFLGWDTVVGSGATACKPGDITNGTWLGECKTHMSEQSRIHIQLAHWIKLEAEATSKFMTAALFVDNGTQRADCTYVIISKRALHRFVLKPVLQAISGRQSKSSTSLTIKTLTEAVKDETANIPHAFTTQVGEYPIVVMTLAHFREALGGGHLC